MKEKRDDGNEISCLPMDDSRKNEGQSGCLGALEARAGVLGGASQGPEIIYVPKVEGRRGH
jgi:hypothetical protein